jgi:hypothetical protein
MLFSKRFLVWRSNKYVADRMNNPYYLSDRVTLDVKYKQAFLVIPVEEGGRGRLHPAELPVSHSRAVPGPLPPEGAVLREPPGVGALHQRDLQARAQGVLPVAHTHEGSRIDHQGIAALTENSQLREWAIAFLKSLDLKTVDLLPGAKISKSSYVVVDNYELVEPDQYRGLFSDERHMDRCFKIELVFDAFFFVKLKEPSYYNYFKPIN